MVKLGDIPVKNSPLTFTVSAKTEGKLNSSRIPDNSSRTISTSPALPDITRASIVPAVINAVSTTTNVEISKPTRKDLSNISSNCGQEKDLAVKTAANGQTPPSQKQEQLMDLVPKKKDEDYLERLVNECEVVKGLGLELTLALLIKEIDRMKAGKIEHSPLTRNLATVSNSSGHGSRTVSHSGPKQTHIAIGPLNLNTVLKLSKILCIPMSRDEKEPERSLHAPIGMCVLTNGDIVVASTFNHKVKMFSSEGNFLRQVDPGTAAFFKPSDMVSLR